MRTFLLLWIIIIVLAGLSCDEKKTSPVGSDVIDRNDFGQFDELQFRPALRDSVIQVQTTTHTGPLLLVGEWSGYQTLSLLKFETLPESIEVASASLTLITYGVIDTQTTVPPVVGDSVRFIVSFLESDWSESDVSFETIPKSSPTKIRTIGRSIADTITIPLPEDTVQGWIDATLPNHGLLLSYAEEPYEPQGQGFIKKFYSSNSQVGPPRLSITWALNDTSDTTVTRHPDADVFVVNRLEKWPFDENPNRLMVGNGFVYRSLLDFFIEDSIPHEATILRGDLTLYIDEMHSFFSSLDVGIYAVTSPTWEDPEFDLYQIAWTTVTADSDSVVFRIYSLLQDWIEGERSNFGLMVRSLHEDWDINSFVFHSSSSEPRWHPKLDVAYGTPPDFGPKTIGEVITGEQ